MYSIKSVTCLCRKVPHTSRHLIGQTINASHGQMQSHWSLFLAPASFFAYDRALIGQRTRVVIVRGHWASPMGVSGSQLIGRWWLVTSRPSQLIGVRSRFEGRSWTGERDRGGSPAERRAEQGGSGQPETQIGPFYISFF